MYPSRIGPFSLNGTSQPTQRIQKTEDDALAHTQRRNDDLAGTVWTQQQRYGGHHAPRAQLTVEPEQEPTRSDPPTAVASQTQLTTDARVKGPGRHTRGTLAFNRASRGGSRTCLKACPRMLASL